jgi:hypothetical protein
VEPSLRALLSRPERHCADKAFSYIFSGKGGRKMKNPSETQTPFGVVDLGSLADIRDVEIDTSQPMEERRESYLRQIKNPYLYRCDDVIVRASFAKTGATLEDRLRQYLLSVRGMAL